MLTTTPELPDTLAPGKAPGHSSARVTWGIVAALLLLVSLGFWPSFEKPAAPMEEGALLVYPELVAHGSIPYRDFGTFSGPANLWVLAAGYKLAGINVFTERSVGLLYRLLIVAMVFVLLRRTGKALAFGCAFLAGCLFFVTQLAAFAWAGAIAFGLAGLWFLSTARGSHRNLFIGGLLLGLSLLYRVDLLPALFLGSVPLLWNRPKGSRRITAFGLALGASAYIFLGFLAGGQQLWNNLILDPLVNCNLLSQILTAAVEPVEKKLLLAGVLGSVVNVFAAFTSLRMELVKANNREVAALLLFATGLLFLQIDRLDVSGVLPIVALSLALLPISILALLQAAKREAHPAWQLGLALATPAAMIFLIAPATSLAIGNSFVSALNPSMASTIFIEQNDRSYPVPSLQVANVTGKLCEHLERGAKPGDRLFVGPGDLEHAKYCDAFIYYLFPKLKPASYSIELHGESGNRAGASLSADVATADWLVLDMAWDSKHKSPQPTSKDSGLNDFVRSKFHLVAQSGPYVLLQHGR